MAEFVNADNVGDDICVPHVVLCEHGFGWHILGSVAGANKKKGSIEIDGYPDREVADPFWAVLT